MDTHRIQEIADILQQAADTLVSIPPLSTSYDPFTLEEAYAVQLYNVERGTKNGRVVSGKKVGLTNKAMQDLLRVDQPDYGHLFSDMEITDGVLEICTMLQPRVEAEIAFVLKKDLASEGPVSIDDVLEATDYVVPSLEIVDSRVKDWKIGISDTVADNASCGRYILGSKRTPIDGFDRLAETMDLYVNDELVGSGNGTAVLGDSAYCVAWLAQKMGQLGSGLKKGDVVLPGALSRMVAVSKGDTVTARFSTIGEVTLLVR